VLAFSGLVFHCLLKDLKDAEAGDGSSGGDSDENLKNKKQNLKIFAYHGKADDVIPEGVAAKTYQVLKEELGFEGLQYKNEDMLGHSASPGQCELAKVFLAGLMK